MNGPLAVAAAAAATHNKNPKEVVAEAATRNGKYLVNDDDAD
jgi:hypothetical protein